MKLGKFLRFDPRYAGKGLMDGGSREFCRFMFNLFAGIHRSPYEFKDNFFTRLRDTIEKSDLAEDVENMKVLLGLLE